jgi:hypothetical protein
MEKKYKKLNIIYVVAVTFTFAALVFFILFHKFGNF